jgi:hypothetical protein
MHYTKFEYNVNRFSVWSTVILRWYRKLNRDILTAISSLPKGPSNISRFCDR